VGVDEDQGLESRRFLFYSAWAPPPELRVCVRFGEKKANDSSFKLDFRESYNIWTKKPRGAIKGNQAGQRLFNPWLLRAFVRTWK